MRFYQAIVIMLASMTSMALSAQSPCAGKIFGRVLDENGQPLANASVIIQPANVGQVTDSAGHFMFTKLCFVEQRVSIQHAGYKTSQIRVMPDAREIVVKLESNVRELNEVIVQDKQQHTDHAHNFSQLSAEALDVNAGKTLGETLKEIPGVNALQSGPGIFKPVIHGVHSQRILILNHGVRQEGQQWGAEHAPEIDPFIASNIIVIKDASSIKYGTDALGGVIVVSPAPLPESAGIGGTMHSVFQSNGRSGTVSGMIEGGLKNYEGWGWRVQGTAKQSGDYHTPDYSLTNSGTKELNFSTAAGYHGKHTGFEIFFSHFQTKLGILKGTSVNTVEDLKVAMDRKVPEYTSSFSYRIGAPRQEVGHNLLKLNSHFDTKNGTFRFQYAFQNNMRREFDIRMGDSLTNKPINDLRLNTHTVEAEWETTKSEKRTFCFGITGLFQQNSNIFGTDRIPFIPNFTNASGGLFGAAKWYLKNWTIDAGVRYDYRKYLVKGYDYKNSLYSADLQFQNISATAGGTLRLPKHRSVSVNLSSAWRPPHVAELYSQGKHVGVGVKEYGLLLNESTTDVMSIQDVSFRNEKAVKLVSTYQHEVKSVEFEFTGFINYIFNYIYLRPTGVSKDVTGVAPKLHYTQTDALFIGADLSAQIALTSNVKIRPRVSLLRASDQRNNDYLVFIPSNKYEMDFRYERSAVLFMKNVFLELKPRFVSKQRREPTVIPPAKFIEASNQQIDPLQGSSKNFDFKGAPGDYFLFNMTTGFSVQQKKTRCDFRVGIENILNTRYREYTNRFRYYANDLGRNIIIAIKYNF